MARTIEQVEKDISTIKSRLEDLQKRKKKKQKEFDEAIARINSDMGKLQSLRMDLFEEKDELTKKNKA